MQTEERQFHHLDFCFYYFTTTTTTTTTITTTTTTTTTCVEMVDGSGLLITLADSANQLVSINIQRERHK